MEGRGDASARRDVRKRDYLSFETLEQGERAGAAFVGGWKGEKAVEDDARLLLATSASRAAVNSSRHSEVMAVKSRCGRGHASRTSS